MDEVEVFPYHNQRLLGTLYHFGASSAQIGPAAKTSPNHQLLGRRLKGSFLIGVGASPKRLEPIRSQQMAGSCT